MSSFEESNFSHDLYLFTYVSKNSKTKRRCKTRDMSIGKTYNAHFFRHKVSFPSERCNAIIVLWGYFFCKCWLWHIPSVTICSAGPGWQLFFISSARNSNSGPQECVGSRFNTPKQNNWLQKHSDGRTLKNFSQSLVGIPTVPISSNGHAPWQWMAAVIFYLITKKQQRQQYSRVWCSGTQDAGETLDQTNFSLSQPFSKPFRRAWSGNGWRMYE